MSVASLTYLDHDCNGVRMTPEEFDAVEDWNDDYQYELIDGAVVVNPIPSEAEVHPNENLGGLLFVYEHYNSEGHHLDLSLAERFIYLPNHRRRADRVIWAGLGRQPDPKADAPTIAVEFVSPGRRNRERDYDTKPDEYMNAGVREYWIIDRFQRTLTAFKKTDDGYTTVVINEDETQTTELLPGFELPLAELLAVADQWEQSE